MGTRSKKNSVECFVVRIYRRDAKDSTRADGIVERSGGDLVTVFHNAGELLEGLDFKGEKAATSRKKKIVRGRA